MNNQTESGPDVFDFDFDADELMSEHSNVDFETEKKSDNSLPNNGVDDDLGPPPRAPGRSSNADVESDPAPKKGKGSTILMIVGTVVFILVLLGGLGWYALQILSPTNSGGQSVPSGQVSTSDASVAAAQTSVHSSDNGQFEPMSQPTESAGWDTMPVNAVQENDVNDYESSVQGRDDSILIDSGLPFEQPAEVSAFEQPAEALTEEERLYDELLEKASALDVVPEAIVIDQNVVRREVESKRVQDLESQIVETRSTIMNLREAVSGIQGHVGELALAIEAGSQSQVELSKSVEALSLSVNEINRERRSDIQALTDGLKRLEARTDEVQNTIRAPKTPIDVVSTPDPVSKPVVTAPIKAPTPSQVVVSDSPAIPKAVAPPAQSKPSQLAAAPAPSASVVTSVDNVAAGEVCAVTRISSVWRVKGVNSTSAYITRPQDRTGLFVKEGVEVPGFGMVQSFDPLTRTICTSSGLIQR